MFGTELWTLLGILGVGQLYVTYRYFNSSYDGLHTGGSSALPMLCYFAMQPEWPDNGTLHPALNATLCTHIMFICNWNKDCQMSYDPEIQHKYFSKVPLLRQQNPDIKLLLTTCGKFTDVLASASNRTRFVKSVIPFLKKYDFDGLDIDWEFAGWQPYPRGQRLNYTLITQELREEFDAASAADGKKYLLSAAVAAGRSVMSIYNVPALAQSLDFINLMCYDLHAYGELDPITDYNSPLYPTDWQEHVVITAGTVGWSSYEWLKRGMPKSKIMVGIPTFTHTWTLEKPQQYHGHYAPAIGPGKPCDECPWPWVCEFLNENGTTYVWDKDAAVPYAYNGDQWVSFDDARSLAAKTQWIIDNKFGGVMVYNMNNDGYLSNPCYQGRFPLLSAIRTVIDNSTRR